jgi:hypothetical protein
MTLSLLQEITSIATLVTAAAAFLAILELRRQRVTAYRPSLAIDDQPVSLYQAQPGGEPRIVFQPDGKLPRRETMPDGGLQFPVRNVGAGAALEVQARWEFDAIEFAAAIAAVDPKLGKGIAVETEFICFQASGYGSWMARRAQVHHLGTLPAAHDSQPAYLPMPFAYALLASAFFQASLTRGLESALRLEFPPLCLSIGFRDRAGSQLDSTYSVALELAFLSEGGGDIPDCPGWWNIGGGTFTVRTA